MRGPSGDQRQAVSSLSSLKLSSPKFTGCVPLLQHTVIPDYSEGGPLAESWATKPASAFKLLCPSGGCADPDEFESCTFGRVRALHRPPPTPPSFLFSSKKATICVCVFSAPQNVPLI